MSPALSSRLIRIGIATVIIVVVNVIARAISRFVLPASVDALTPALISLLVAVVAAAVIGFWLARQQRLLPTALDLLLVTMVSTLLVVFAAAYISGKPSFDFTATGLQLALHAGLLIIGFAAGVLGAIAPASTRSAAPGRCSPR
ncbi:hypothetical protein [Fodinicola feengrottensis]|uniref:hypothetical protein n=1 Tax=Fodinicola feengrottensis TaxID=435914 RepID=UPI0013D321C6|nr:hypothetical protein [Fodinicola feengrottensis]